MSATTAQMSKTWSHRPGKSLGWDVLCTELFGTKPHTKPGNGTDLSLGLHVFSMLGIEFPSWFYSPTDSSSFHMGCAWALISSHLFFLPLLCRSHCSHPTHCSLALVLAGDFDLWSVWEVVLCLPKKPNSFTGHFLLINKEGMVLLLHPDPHIPELLQICEEQ